MNFKRYIETSDTWVDSHYIMGTSTDTLTTLPAVVYPNAATATVGLKGQAVQSSVPSPTSPVMPQGCGNKTANLLNPNNFTLEQWTDANGNVSSQRYGAISNKIIINTSGYTIKAHGETYPYSCSFCWYDDNDVFISRTHYASTIENEKTATAPNNAEYFKFQVATTTQTTITVDIIKNFKIMLNTGSTALPYEPYGYKIPILSADTTTPVYLGEVETTRKIIKLVLTGEENWEQVTAGDNTYIRLDIGVLNTYIGDAIVCTHCGYANISSSTSGYGCDILNSVGSNRDFLCFRLQGYQGNTIFKQYLEAQYAAGTPVTVWYVLATPTTGIVNEPLMRIGDYADTLSNISIPVTAGGDTLSVGTTVQPSEVTVNYKGWHPVSSVHERDNGAWT